MLLNPFITITFNFSGGYLILSRFVTCMNRQGIFHFFVFFTLLQTFIPSSSLNLSSNPSLIFYTFSVYSHYFSLINIFMSSGRFGCDRLDVPLNSISRSNLNNNGYFSFPSYFWVGNTVFLCLYKK